MLGSVGLCTLHIISILSSVRGVHGQIWVGGGGGGGRGGGVRRMISKVVLSTILPTTTKQKLSALSSLTKCRTG